MFIASGKGAGKGTIFPAMCVRRLSNSRHNTSLRNGDVGTMLRAVRISIAAGAGETSIGQMVCAITDVFGRVTFAIRSVPSFRCGKRACEGATQFREVVNTGSELV